MKKYPLKIKKILLAVSTLHDLTPLTTVIALAERLQAQLDTLFVEDINLLHLAELPFAHELDRVSGELRPVNLSLMEQALQVEAQRIRNTLVSSFKDKHIQWNLQVVRGNYINEVLSVTDVDVLFMPGSKRMPATQTKKAPSRHNKLTRTANSPVYVYFKDDEESGRTLKLASEIAQLLDNELIILLPELTESLINSANALIGAN